MPRLSAFTVQDMRKPVRAWGSLGETPEQHLTYRRAVRGDRLTTGVAVGRGIIDSSGTCWESSRLSRCCSGWSAFSFHELASRIGLLCHAMPRSFAVVFPVVVVFLALRYPVGLVPSSWEPLGERRLGDEVR